MDNLIKHVFTRWLSFLLVVENILKNVGHSSSHIFKVWGIGCPALIWKCTKDENMETETYNNETKICV